MKEYIKSLLLLLATLLFMFCLGEIALRIAGYAGEQSLRMSYAYSVDDPVLNYRFKPDSVYSIGAVQFHFNSNGIRDDEIPFKKENGIYRILMLGDSVAEGYGVHLQDTVGKQLSAILNANRLSPKFEVINVAMGGLNTFQEAHLLKILGVKYSPDLIILAHVLNDAEGGVFYNPNKKEKKYETINVLNIRVPAGLKRTLKKSSLLFFMKNRIDSLLWRFNINDSDDPMRSIETDYFHKIYKNEKLWQAVVKGFSSIEEISKELECDVIMLIFPVMYDFQQYNWKDLHKKVKLEGEKHGFHIIDLFDEYAQYPVKSVRLERGDFVHPNTKGHKVATDALFNYITKNVNLD